MHLCQYMQRTCLFLLCSFLTAASATAQEERTFSAQSNLVRVPTLVLDRNGAPVLGLSLANFIVEDDGIAQTAHMDEGAESEPIAYSARLLGQRPKDHKRVLLLISETRDHGSQFTKLDEALKAVDGNEVSVYALP